MKQQINLSACAGKTIAAVAGLFENRLIVFTDGTFAHFRAAHDYDGAVEINDCEYKVGRSDVSHDECVAAGLYTESELAVLLANRDAEWKLRQLASEREQYERLKAKFNPSTSGEKA